jgi:hypothetical protein
VIANGGQHVVTPDGKLHTDDPQVRDAYIKSVAYLTSAYLDGLYTAGRADMERFRQ